MKADINGGPLLCYLIFTLIKINKNLNFCHLLCLLPNNTISLLWTLARFIHFSQMVTHTNQCLSLCSHLPFHSFQFGIWPCCLLPAWDVSLLSLFYRLSPFLSFLHHTLRERSCFFLSALTYEVSKPVSQRAYLLHIIASCFQAC